MNRNEAIKIVKSHYPANKQMLNEALEFLIPELAESEDERIRNFLIDYINHIDWGDWDFSRKQCIDWLEKQGVQKSLDDVAKEVTKNKETAMSFLKSCGIMNANGELADEYKVEQGEQKSADSYCQKNCKGFQETGKCFADGDCKAKREVEFINIC